MNLNKNVNYLEYKILCLVKLCLDSSKFERMKFQVKKLK